MREKTMTENNPLGDLKRTEEKSRTLGNLNTDTDCSETNVDITGFSSKEKCPICLDAELHIEMQTLPCSHAFHKVCITVWLESKHSCPVCRFSLPSSKQTTNGISDADSSEDDESEDDESEDDTSDDDDSEDDTSDDDDSEDDDSDDDDSDDMERDDSESEDLEIGDEVESGVADVVQNDGYAVRYLMPRFLPRDAAYLPQEIVYQLDDNLFDDDELEIEDCDSLPDEIQAME